MTWTPSGLVRVSSHSEATTFREQAAMVVRDYRGAANGAVAFVHSVHQAVVLAVPMRDGGLGNAALIDLAMRSCPPGLQGTLMMLIALAQMFARRGSDVLGSWIYGLSRDNGFLYCVIVTTAVYALMLPVILLTPKELIATGDGEPTELSL